MAVRVHVDGLKSRFSSGNIAKARYAAANQALLNMNKYVPYSGENSKQNHLRDMSYVSNDGDSIIWNAKYATAQFYGFVNGREVRRYTTPGTSKRWDQRLTGNNQDMREVTDAFKNTLMKG